MRARTERDDIASDEKPSIKRTITEVAIPSALPTQARKYQKWDGGSRASGSPPPEAGSATLPSNLSSAATLAPTSATSPATASEETIAPCHDERNSDGTKDDGDLRGREGNGGGRASSDGSGKTEGRDGRGENGGSEEKDGTGGRGGSDRGKGEHGTSDVGGMEGREVGGEIGERGEGRGGREERVSSSYLSEHALAVSYSTMYERIRQEAGENGFPLELQRQMARHITQAYELEQQITPQRQQWQEVFVKLLQQQFAAARASQGSLTPNNSLPHYPSGT